MTSVKPFDPDAFLLKYPPPPAPPAAAAARRTAQKEGVDLTDTDWKVRCAARYLAATPGAVDGQGGHNHTFNVACLLVNGFALDYPDALSLLGDWNAKCQPPWSGEELDHKISDAFAKEHDKPRGHMLPARNQGPAPAVRVVRPKPTVHPGLVDIGDAPAADTAAAPAPEGEVADNGNNECPVISNFEVTGTYTDNTGRERERKDPCTAPKVDENREAVVGDWPKRIGKELFVEDAGHVPKFFRNTVDLFGWFDGFSWVRWQRGGDFVTQDRYFSHLTQTADHYAALEILPHWPQRPDTYYMHKSVTGPGDGRALEGFLDFFNPATEVDRELIKAFLLTLFWGGDPGDRPTFVVTAKDDDTEKGRGVGKSTLTAILADELAGGFIDVLPSEEIAAVKTRLLSDEGRMVRMARVDNLKTFKLSWADLEGLITSPVISGKKLYVGEGRRPNLITWVITVNGANMSDDMAKRMVMIQLDRPEYSPTWERDVRTYARVNRDNMLADVGALLTRVAPSLLAATRWSAWEQAVLSKLKDPEACQGLILARQASANMDDDDSADVRAYFASKIPEYRLVQRPHAVRIASQTAAAWVSEALRQNLKTNQASAFLTGLQIPELKHVRTKSWRGWTWSSLDDDGNPLYQGSPSITELPIIGPADALPS